jgi:Translation initiation factor eIF3 subunit 135
VSGSGTGYTALTNWESSAWDEGPSIVEVLHLHGVNLRHLGLLRAHVGQLLREKQQQQQQQQLPKQQQQQEEDAPLSADAVQRIEKLRWRLLLEMLSRALKSLLRERQVCCWSIIHWLLHTIMTNLVNLWSAPSCSLADQIDSKELCCLTD